MYCDRTIAPYHTEDLLAYFDSICVNGIFRGRQNGNNVQVRGVFPRFPPNKWNVHERTLADEPRTSNFCEGWNSRFSSLVDYTHPSIWKAIKRASRERLMKSIQRFCKQAEVIHLKMFVTQQEKLHKFS